MCFRGKNILLINAFSRKKIQKSETQDTTHRDTRILQSHERELPGGSGQNINIYK